MTMRSTAKKAVNVKRTGLILNPDRARVLVRPFGVAAEPRAVKIVARVMALSEEEVRELLKEVHEEFSGRHNQMNDIFLERFQQVKHLQLTDHELTEERKLLIGSYFVHEYSVESAALFNPSIVPHTDQSELPEGSLRFIMSLRATGEGHISSITFRSGTVDAESQITVNEPTRLVTAPKPVLNRSYDKAMFEKKLFELGLFDDFAQRVMAGLGDEFAFKELAAALELAERTSNGREKNIKMTADGIKMLAKSNYEIQYRADQRLSERIIFPSSPSQSNGIEDARFVLFRDDDGTETYYGVYTAYDGKLILPQLIETKDFLHFRISTLNGPGVQNKGMALFPRKINGTYAMLSRQDNENIYVMCSDNVHFWYDRELVLKPTYPWEFVQLGNCGSPIETEAGWLVLSHGVGPMRKYCIGAFLLDLENPGKVIGRLREPLLKPSENEREGYVPNVVYTCGALLHGRELILPYAVSDYATSFATASLDEILAAME